MLTCGPLPLLNWLVSMLEYGIDTNFTLYPAAPWTELPSDPQLWQNGGPLSYIFQNGVIIARFTEQRNMTH